MGSIVGVEKGDVAGQCIGALVCASVIMLLIIVILFLI